MYAVETDILSQSNTKPLEWKRYIDDVLFLWDTNREEIDKFILDVRSHFKPTETYISIYALLLLPPTRVQ